MGGWIYQDLSNNNNNKGGTMPIVSRPPVKQTQEESSLPVAPVEQQEDATEQTEKS